MVTPIAQMWKLRPRKVRVGTLGPVPHPRSLLGSRLSRFEAPLRLDVTWAAGRTNGRQAPRADGAVGDAVGRPRRADSAKGRGAGPPSASFA